MSDEEGNKLETAYMIVSYVPLLDNPLDAAGQTFDLVGRASIKKLVDLVDQTDNTVNGVLWCGDKNVGYHPVLVIEHAKAIAEHLIFWSEDNPEEWFDLKYYFTDERYYMALYPRLEKSVKRFRSAVEMKTGLPPDKNSKFNILFKPLTYVSSENASFQRIKDSFVSQSKVSVGLIDITDVKIDWGTIDKGLIHPISEFNLIYDKGLADWLQD